MNIRPAHMAVLALMGLSACVASQKTSQTIILDEMTYPIYREVPIQAAGSGAAPAVGHVVYYQGTPLSCDGTVAGCRQVLVTGIAEIERQKIIERQLDDE